MATWPDGSNGRATGPGRRAHEIVVYGSTAGSGAEGGPPPEPDDAALNDIEETMTEVHPSNTDTAAAWEGATGDVWTDHADQFDAGVTRYLQPFLDAAAIEPSAQVLDIGCGAGQTTREAARLAPAGSATGVDLSTRLLDLARQRAAQEGLSNTRFVHADAQVADLGVDRYDRVISRTGVMFFGDPVAAFSNLGRALKPDGRMVLLVWQPFTENEWMQSFLQAISVDRDFPPPPPDRPGPFTLGDPERVRTVLTAAGFDEPRLVDLREPMYYGPDVATAEEHVLGIVSGQLDELDDIARPEARAALRTTLLDHHGPDGVTFHSAMWLVTTELAS